MTDAIIEIMARAYLLYDALLPDAQERARGGMRDIVTALEAAGYTITKPDPAMVTVPREPTEAMVGAAWATSETDWADALAAKDTEIERLKNVLTEAGFVVEYTAHGATWRRV